MPANVGEKMRARRVELGLSLEKVARRAGTTRSHLWEIERGQNVPSILIGLRLARALATSVEALFGEDEMPPAKPELVEAYRAEDRIERAIAVLRGES